MKNHTFSLVGLGDPISGDAVVPSGDRQKKRSEDKAGGATGAETGVWM